MNGFACGLVGVTSFTLALGPLGELLPLFPNIHKSRPNLEDLERIPAIVLLNLSCTVSEPVRPLTLNLPCPHVPSDWAKLGGSDDETEAHHQSRN